MLSQKTLLWALAALLAAGGMVVWQRQRQTTPLAQTTEVKKQEESPEGKAEDKPPPPPEPKATVLSTDAREHLAEKAFIAALRDAFLWHGAQPETEATRRAWLEKLAAIPSDELPPERKQAWQTLLQAWQSLADAEKAKDSQLRQQGRQAADVLNVMFKEHGDGDMAL